MQSLGFSGTLKNRMDLRTRFQIVPSIDLVCLSAIGGITLAIGVSRMLYPFDVGHYEGGIWEPASGAFRGENPYSIQLTSHAPFVMAPYGPVYYWLIGLGQYLFGVQFWFGRALSIAGILVSTWCLGTLCRQFTGDRALALMSMAIFLALFPVQFWIGVQRPDLAALTLALLGLTLGLHPTRTRVASAVFVALAGLLLVAAILCRQTTVLPILVLSGWYLLHRMYGQLFGLLLVVVAGLFAVAYRLETTSDGGYLWQNFVLQAGVARSVTNVIAQIKGLAKTPVFWVLVVTSVWLWRKRKRSLRTVKHGDVDCGGIDAPGAAARRGFLLLIGYFFATVVLAAITGSRAGANLNYWLEACAAVSLLLPAAWAETSVRTRVASPTALSVVLVGLLLAASFTGVRSLRGEYFRWRSLGYFREITRVIQSRTPTKNPCFSVYPELIAYADRPYWFNDFCQYDGRSRLHQELLHDAIRRRCFSAIVSHDPHPPEGYQRVRLSEPVPVKFYAVYLFLRTDGGERRGTADCERISSE